MKRVVVTGMGAITPIGNTVEEYWENLIKGKVGFNPITKFDSKETGITLAGEVKEFNPQEMLDRKEYKRMDLFSQYGLVAALQAWEDSGLSEQEIDPKRLGVIVGSGIGGMTTLQDQVRVMDKKGPKRVTPFFVPMVIANMVAGNISIRLGAKGPSQTVVTACASATNAIGEAFEAIKNGKMDMMVTGGAEAAVCEIGISGFAALSALSTSTDPNRASIPFDAERTGFVMGEGAGMLILEELEHAQRRGAKILGEIVGYGNNCDASHMTAPLKDGSGAAGAIEQALTEATIKPEQVNYINAHGTSTAANDAAETTAIHRVFGDNAAKIPVSSTKSMIGHLLGAGGGVEAIACIKTLQEGVAHPTAGYQVVDPACDLDYISEGAREINAKYAISNSFGFGGHNAVICMKKWEEK
ncbi:beta-ketoacyl-ACP synthase II [Melissococcus plutonius]|uniref:3-oxoacyl-[acyl-carrier-protein] synthase 2 n=1 Tax=Melissococcus plutonius TaxID=33970 RepID=A0A2Z5Y0C9_9ENTE|nr:beta-ketoacyl-ACP synthase II [Melissococcus plutonius]BAL61408.1 3-oxoacyl-[acyl-carrier-protein] synthase KASII [Melissococcus plutonius DAT561]MCV2498808.1 beta-ketoacyl-ACP synthase II [Melissococcus plutonius]MCV2501044.1 beta-ketoacyl-ACP synthase II [Melissococcus plutonius]MCV2504914.1 beta-ketoacyl-ACP synthase II [Melissococcus plutonius]MCV2507424.1 beta-ketoacyl-ACP synthase II [Melissococcus plutonius]